MGKGIYFYLDGFPVAPCMVLPWNAMQSPGWQSQLRRGHLPDSMSGIGTDQNFLKKINYKKTNWS